ncbi:M55 family metallopeptidase, partial [bacterium]|nr:M55 family metallopeptidase [bacterium]
SPPPSSFLSPPMTGSLYSVEINGKKMPEAGVNALIAGHFGVPVVFVAGDSAICHQSEELLGDQVVTAAVKEGIGEAAQMLHPQKARELIKKKTQEALSRLDDFNPYQLDSPYTMEVIFKDEEDAENAAWIPGAQRTGPTSVSFTSSDFIEVLKFFKFARS